VPASNVTGFATERASVPAGTATCDRLSGRYAFVAGNTDFNVPSGTYCYRAGALNPATGLRAFGYSSPATIPNPPDPIWYRPTSEDARVISRNGRSPSTFDGGDDLRLAFNEPMRTCSTGTTFRLRDADGTVADVMVDLGECGIFDTPQTLGAVTYPAFQVLSVIVGEIPTEVSRGSVTGLQLPATVIGQSGVVDEDGYPWDLTLSPDVVLGDPD